MKKAMIIALAGFMMIAFTQCGGSGSQEYKDMMDYLKKAEKAINSAKNCDDLDKASDLFWKGAEEKDYAKDDEMTEEERTKVLQYLEKVGQSYKDLIEKLDCD